MPQAPYPDGAPENVVRIVTENSRTLKFVDHRFESEWLVDIPEYLDF